MFEDAEIIHTYTRAEALEDGVLVDVSEIAREAGFTVPVALTRAAWEDCVAWDESDNARKRTLQDEAGRLWDVLWMARLSARAAATRGLNEKLVPVRRTPRAGRGHLPRQAVLKMVIGPGDTPDPVITIMLRDED